MRVRFSAEGHEKIISLPDDYRTQDIRELWLDWLRETFNGDYEELEDDTGRG